MTKPEPAVVLGPALSAALEKKGFTELTSIQLAVLDPEIEGRDLRITSQTGSGKTVAIGFTLRNIVVGMPPAKPGPAIPRALVITPTRELAKQVEAELSWLFQPLGVRTASVIGGASYRDERRALSGGPAVVVGTPGRLFDHLERGSIDPSGIAAVVLDEADRMLDMGFREELEAILARTPSGRLTHLASATFPREVRALADRVQKNPVHLEGTRLGVANVDIDHVIHLIDPDERMSAIINLLCAAPEARSLIFARTRLDVTHIATELDVAGFAVGTLSGDMEQRERSRALAAFKRGQLRALVATDVAARGIDVPEVSDVIHVEAPNDADAYTHRSGRTGRAGRKGRSAILASLRELGQAQRILKRAGVPHRFEPVPSAHDIRSSLDDRIVDALTREETEELDAPEDKRIDALAERITQGGDVKRALRRLLVRLGPAESVEPRDVRRIAPPAARPTLERVRGERPQPRARASRAEAYERNAAPRSAAPHVAPIDMPKPRRSEPRRPEPIDMPKPRRSEPRRPEPIEAPKPRRSEPRRPEPIDAPKPRRSEPRPAVALEVPKPRRSEPRRPEPIEAPKPRRSEPRPAVALEVPKPRRSEPKRVRTMVPQDAPRGASPSAAPMPRDAAGTWTTFQVTWGDVHGADPRRLLALVCRRGNIRGGDVGAIRVGRTSSVVEIARHVAESFARATRERDPRDPRVQIREDKAAGDTGAVQAPPYRPSDRPPPRTEASKTKPRPHAKAGKPPKRMRAR